jgi:hypothetical protein
LFSPFVSSSHIQVIPIPPPRDLNPDRAGTIWVGSFTLEQQKRCLELILHLTLTFATMWQGVEHPTRYVYIVIIYLFIYSSIFILAFLCILF